MVIRGFSHLVPSVAHQQLSSLEPVFVSLRSRSLLIYNGKCVTGNSGGGVSQSATQQAIASKRQSAIVRESKFPLEISAYCDTYNGFTRSIE